VSTMQTIQKLHQIAVDPTVRSGRPYVVGTTVTVADVVMAKLYHGQDADGIADWYSLTLAQVYAALAYYYDHKAALDEQIREQIRRAETAKEQRIGSPRSLLSR
jgi:uncharacterized protein (DUF433 family)